MKHLFALVFLSVCFAAALGAQDTVRFTACTQHWKTQQPIKGTTIFVELNGMPYSASTGPDKHCAEMVVPTVGLPPDASVFLYATKDSVGLEDQPVNGVSVGDVLKVSCHILGLEPLPSPFSMIATDINRSGSISTFDIVEMRKAILGTYKKWPNNVVWRFFPDFITFEDPSNPFKILPSDLITPFVFKGFNNKTIKMLGIKTGDVDSDVSLTSGYTGPPKIADTLLLTMPHALLPANTTVEVPISTPSHSIGGFQVEFKTVPGVDIIDFVPQGGELNPTNTIFSILSDKTYRLVAHKSPSLIYAGTPLHMKIVSDQTVALQDVLSIGDGIPFLGFGICGNKASKLMLNFDGTLPAHDAAETPLRATPPAPNPFTDKALVKIELPESMPVLLEVFDLGGRLTWQQEQVLGSGQQQLEIPAEAVAPGSMGLYRVRAGAGVARGKVIRE